MPVAQHLLPISRILYINSSLKDALCRIYSNRIDYLMHLAFRACTRMHMQIHANPDPTGTQAHPTGRDPRKLLRLVRQDFKYTKWLSVRTYLSIHMLRDPFLTLLLFHKTHLRTDLRCVSTNLITPFPYTRIPITSSHQSYSAGGTLPNRGYFNLLDALVHGLQIAKY